MHHGVRITDAALVAAATLSDRYITDRFLPDKAIDLVDEAASRLRMEIDSRPVEVDEIERAVRRLEIEEMALAKESDAAVARAAGRAARRAGREARGAGRADRALAEREGRTSTPIRELKEQLEQLRGEAERAERDVDLGRASELRYGRIPALEKELAEKSRPRSQHHERVDAQGGGRRRTTSPTWCPRGPASRPAACWRARPPSCCGWRRRWAAASSARPRPCARCPTRCAGPAPGSPTRTGRPGRSCSSGPPASARPSWPRRWPSSCSTTSGRWSAST